MATSMLLATVVALAGNPLVPHVGMADPNLHFFNGSWHIFATHDFSVNNTGELSRPCREHAFLQLEQAA